MIINNNFIKIIDIPYLQYTNYLFYIKDDLFSPLIEKFKIIKLDKNFLNVESFEISRNYTLCCYDNVNHCIWAICKNSKNNIYKLDFLFREIEIIKLNIKNIILDKIKNISFDFERNLILITSSYCVAYFSIKGDYVETFLKKDKRNIKYTSSICYKGFIFISYFFNNNSYVDKYYKTGKYIGNIKIGINLYIYNLQIAYRKNRYVLCLFGLQNNIYKKIYYIPIIV